VTYTRWVWNEKNRKTRDFPWWLQKKKGKQL